MENIINIIKYSIKNYKLLYIVEAVKSDTHDLSNAATVGMIVAVIGTPIVLATRKIVDKVFPSYEF